MSMSPYQEPVVRWLRENRLPENRVMRMEAEITNGRARIYWRGVERRPDGSYSVHECSAPAPSGTMIVRIEP